MDLRPRGTLGRAEIGARQRRAPELTTEGCTLGLAAIFRPCPDWLVSARGRRRRRHGRPAPSGGVTAFRTRRAGGGHCGRRARRPRGGVGVCGAGRGRTSPLPRGRRPAAGAGPCAHWRLDRAGKAVSLSLFQGWTAGSETTWADSGRGRAAVMPPPVPDSSDGGHRRVGRRLSIRAVTILGAPGPPGRVSGETVRPWSGRCAAGPASRPPQGPSPAAIPLGGGQHLNLRGLRRHRQAMTSWEPRVSECPPEPGPSLRVAGPRTRFGGGCSWNCGGPFPRELSRAPASLLQRRSLRALPGWTAAAAISPTFAPPVPVFARAPENVTSQDS